MHYIVRQALNYVPAEVLDESHILVFTLAPVPFRAVLPVVSGPMPHERNRELRVGSDNALDSHRLSHLQELNLYIRLGSSSGLLNFIFFHLRTYFWGGLWTNGVATRC